MIKAKEATKVMLLFLDFDGVLHPCVTLEDETDAVKAPFCCLPRLEAVLREVRGVQIVITSDWRKYHTLEELRAFFSPDIAARIVGVTDIDNTDLEIGNRQRAVERYLRSQGLNELLWVAIDDDPGNYRAGATLVLCNDGFRESEEVALRAVLSALETPDGRVLAAATTFNGNPERAAEWYRTQALDEFNGKTPEELVREGRERDVLKYIEMLDAGFRG